jgi:hypothetical protein
MAQQQIPPDTRLVDGKNIINSNATDAQMRLSGAETHAGRTDNPHGVTAAQAGAAPSAHDHDSRYYTETEVNDLLAARDVERDPVRTARIFEDFASGAGGASGNQGSLGWTYVNGTFSPTIAEAGRVGVFRRTTSATAGTYATAFSHSNTNAGNLLGSESWSISWGLRINTNDIDTLVRAGLGVSVTDPPADCTYLEKSLGETNWYGVCRSGGVESRTAILAASTAGWAKLSARRVDATTVAFSVDGGAEVTLAVNTPTAPLLPYLAVLNTAAVDKSVDVDYMLLIVRGLSR